MSHLVDDIYMPALCETAQYTKLKCKHAKMTEELTTAQEKLVLFIDNELKSHAIFNLCVQVNLAIRDQELKRNPRLKEVDLDCYRLFRLSNDMVPPQLNVYEQDRQTLYSIQNECTALQERLLQSQDAIRIHKMNAHRSNNGATEG